MKTRCPSATFIGVARLPGYGLTFNRESINRGCGVADVVREAGGSVWGAIFEIQELDVGQFDRSEGYQRGRERNSYWCRECKVFVDCDERRAVTAETYFAEREPAPPPPNQAYKDLILSGARHWHLPIDYIARLEAIEARK
jgi:hypothetical protein